MKGWYGGVLPGIKKDKNSNVVEDAVITDRPLAVTSFGISKITKESYLFNNRQNGRKDYLISFISKGVLIETAAQITTKENSMVLYKPNQPQQRNLYNNTPSQTYWIHFFRETT